MESGVSKVNYSIISSIFFIFLFFMFVLAPTSTNGNLPEVNEVIISWSILSAIILIAIIFLAKINWIHFLVVLSVIVFTVIVTVISSQYDSSGRFSIARLAPIVCFLVLSVLTIKKIIPLRLVEYVVHFFMCTFIVWNTLIIIGDNTIQDFTISNYSQLYEKATSNMFIKNRPVMSFGIYTFASYFYFLFFLVSKSLLNITNNKIYLLYLIVILIANILLFSNTSFVFSLIMVGYLFFSFEKVKSKIIFTTLLLFSIFSIIYYYFDYYQIIVVYYNESFYSTANGILGRYSTTGTLNVNLTYLENNFFIGFNIIENLTYTDSGYIVYYTMGGPILLIAMFFSLYKFAKNNFSINYLLFLLPTMFFEIALPVMIYYKFIYAALFFAIAFKSIEYHRKKIK